MKSADYRSMLGPAVTVVEWMRLCGMGPERTIHVHQTQTTTVNLRASKEEEG